MVDNYAWLNDKEDQNVLNYIESENKYTDILTKDTEDLQTLLYKEFITNNDNATSDLTPKELKSDGFVYYTRQDPLTYSNIYCRIDNLTSLEHIYLLEDNVKVLVDYVEGGYFHIAFVKIRNGICAVGVDCIGNERNSVLFISMQSGKEVSDRVEEVYEDFEFSMSGACCYYTILDEVERAYKMIRHFVYETPGDERDQVMYFEEDEMFFLALRKSCDGMYIFLSSGAQVTSETRFLLATDDSSCLTLIFDRVTHVQYTTESHEGYFYTLTNEDSKNNWIFKTKIPGSSQLNPDELKFSGLKLNDSSNPVEEAENDRETVIAHRDFVLIEDFGLRKNHLILFERSNCHQNIRIVDMKSSNLAYYYIPFTSQIFSIWPGVQKEEYCGLIKSGVYESEILVFSFTSFVDVGQVVEYNMDTRDSRVIHTDGIDGYDKELYESKRIYATGFGIRIVYIDLYIRWDCCSTFNGLS